MWIRFATVRPFKLMQPTKLVNTEKTGERYAGATYPTEPVEKVMVNTRCVLSL